MKKFLCAMAIHFALFSGKSSYAQSFTVSFPDTFAHGPAINGSALTCWIDNLITNVSGDSLVLDVVRVEDDTATPGWISAFCFQTCQSPFIDSLRATMAPSEVVNMAVHFIVTDIPDSGTILMKIKNVNDPAEVIYQRFYCSSQDVAGISGSGDARKTEVKVYPLPVRRGKDFSMFISTNQSVNDLNLSVYNIYGSRLACIGGLRNGLNTLNFNIPGGAYFFSLTSKGTILDTGRLIFVD